MATQRDMITEILRQVSGTGSEDESNMSQDAKNKKMMNKMRGNERAPMESEDSPMDAKEDESEYGMSNGVSSKNAANC